jgi:hypothetical protein
MRRLLKLAAYARAPMATFVLLHPVRALKWGAALYAGRKLYERLRRVSDRIDSERIPSAR